MIVNLSTMSFRELLVKLQIVTCLFLVVRWDGMGWIESGEFSEEAQATRCTEPKLKLHAFSSKSSKAFKILDKQ